MNLSTFSVRRGHRDDDEAGQFRGAASSGENPGFEKASARRPQQDSGVPRRDAADGEPGQIPFRWRSTTTTVGDVDGVRRHHA